MTDLPHIHLDIDDLDDALADAEANEMILPPPGEPEHRDAVMELAGIARAHGLAFDVERALRQPLPAIREAMLFRLAASRLH